MATSASYLTLIVLGYSDIGVTPQIKIISDCPLSVSLTHPPEQVLLRGRVEDFGYLQVGIHTEAVFWSSRGWGSRRAAILFVSLRSRLHMRILWHLETKNETKLDLLNSFRHTVIRWSKIKKMIH